MPAVASRVSRWRLPCLARQFPKRFGVLGRAIVSTQNLTA